MNKKLIILLGPTASGKTKYSLLLAQKLKTEIVISDSRQVYKHLDIGTAKPSNKERKKIKHHLIDIITPPEGFNLAVYQNKAFKTIKALFEKHDNVILSGGTALYIDAVCKAYNLPAHDGDLSATRKKLEDEVKKHGLAHLYEKLKEKDPESAGKIHPNDKIRILRALEVSHLSGRSISSFKTLYPHPLNCSIIKIGFAMEREKLYNRINARVEEMIKEGLLDECGKLISLGYKESIEAKGIIGYNEMFKYLEGSLSLEEATELLKKNTRNYAKRQLTWFRRDKDIHWIDLDKNNTDKEVIKKLLQIIQ
ncbi:MAG: tRNA (adenosine(37)-N6)-dimethylallyltransferase MiaA [Armatimonadota bacterium]